MRLEKKIMEFALVEIKKQFYNTKYTDSKKIAHRKLTKMPKQKRQRNVTSKERNAEWGGKKKEEKKKRVDSDIYLANNTKMVRK